jgi:hypothetical protein
MARRVLWYPTQAKTRLEWGTQPSLPVNAPKAIRGMAVNGPTELSSGRCR